MSGQHTNNPPGDDYRPGCRNPDCPCQRPGRPCDEFMGIDGDHWCPRCGWAQRLHATAGRLHDLDDVLREAGIDPNTI